MSVRSRVFGNAREAQDVMGARGEAAEAVERLFGVKATARDLSLKLDGDAAAVERADRAVGLLVRARDAGMRLHGGTRGYFLEEAAAGRWESAEELLRLRVDTMGGKPPVFPRTAGQARLLKAIRGHTLTIGLGPAGTGKTWLAMAAAVEALSKQEVTRIVLTRPAVEAGEALGFLPGDLQQKILPYLRPLYDALREMMPGEMEHELTERGVIEVAPLAYMRGRTLNRSFVILDEAQNTTREQMLMFLTRLGFDSKAVVNGDLTQVDLPAKKESGLREAARLLDGVEDAAVVRMGAGDVVRHPLVQRIVEAYGKAHSEAARVRGSEQMGKGSAAVDEPAAPTGK